MTDSDKKDSGIKVEIYRIANRLKDKLGMRVMKEEPGFIDPDAVAEAERLIIELCKECPATLAGYLEEVAEHWHVMRELPAGKEREVVAREMFTLAHEIKDVGSMCGHNMAAYLAESLRDYIENTELSLEAQRVIIQAHVDALHVVIKQDMREADTPQAEELKKMVKVATDKYR